MVKINLLRLLISMENLFCIYRNFYLLNKPCRVLAVVRVVFMFILNISTCVSLIVTTYSESSIQVFIFIYYYLIFTTTNSLIPVFIALTRAYDFKILISSFGKLREYCAGDATYDRRVDNLRKNTLILIAFLLTCYMAGFLMNVSRLIGVYSDSYFFDACFAIFQTLIVFWREIRFQLEFLIFSVCIKVVIICLMHLNTELMTFLETLDGLKEGIDEVACSRLREDLRKWSSAYNGLVLCGGLLKQCFGIQVVFSLFILTCYFIGLSYIVIANVVSQDNGNIGLKLMLINYTLAMISLLYMGQCAQNQAECLKRLMARLHNRILLFPGSNMLELRRSVRDLYRQMTVEPIKIKILSTTNVEMSLFLVILSTSISYTIVFLQFSHIV